LTARVDDELVLSNAACTKAALPDPLRGFPTCQVVWEAQGQTLRQAAVSAGIDPDADRLTVGIPEICFVESLLES
jgi:hypothetical protein